LVKTFWTLYTALMRVREAFPLLCISHSRRLTKTYIAVMLVCMIFIVSGRLYIRVRDRKIAEAENGALMRDINNQGIQI